MNDFIISVKSVVHLPAGKTQEDTMSPSIQPAGTQPTQGGVNNCQYFGQYFVIPHLKKNAASNWLFTLVTSIYWTHSSRPLLRVRPAQIPF